MRACKPREDDKGKVVAKRKINPLSPPTTVEISGVSVHFPFRPYPVQENYMKKVMEALLRSENALLESPTGTGKTLCLLCAALAWQREQGRIVRDAALLPQATQPQDANAQKTSRRKTPVIVYASRTHSQLSQVVRELRNTRYRPRHALLGAREHFCVNPKVRRKHATGSEINHDCSRLNKERACRFRNHLDTFVAPHNEQGLHSHQVQPVRDLEELVQMGNEHRVCPYYYTRDSIPSADLILMPYNYLFEKDARASMEIPWNNAVVIFDEAHNLESFASESASFDLSSVDIAGCIRELERAIAFVENDGGGGGYGLRSDNLYKLKAIFLKLEEHILNLPVQQTAYAGEFIMEIFRQGAMVTHGNYELLIEELRKVNDYAMDNRGSHSKGGGAPRLEHFIGCLKRVFGHQLESRCLAKAAFYRVHVSPPNPTQGRTISYWCFAPALAMEELANLQVRSIIVTSGTLSPLPSYRMELGIKFSHTIENPHIIDDHQIHVQVFGKGVSGKLLSSSYERRQDTEYFIELGNTLIALCKVVPMGMLVFFPSYSIMETCLERWGGPRTRGGKRDAQDTKPHNFFARKGKLSHKQSQYSFPRAPMSCGGRGGPQTPWRRLLSTKAIVVEPRSAHDLSDAISEYKRFLELPKSSGAILMGVCRGKISEGIDFSHDMSRAVVITGLPFPPAYDPKVTLKKDFLDKTKRGRMEKGSMQSMKLTGHEWYTQQAHRAVNQAIGRVIRNLTDYGAVLLLDARFDQCRNQEGLSRWLRPYIKRGAGFGTAVRSLGQFYQEAASYMQRQKEANAKAETSVLASRLEEANAPLVPLDPIDVDVTKVAFIRNDDQGAAGKSVTDKTYVPPDQVTRVDMQKSAAEQVGPKKAHLEPAATEIAADSAAARRNAVFAGGSFKSSTMESVKSARSTDTKAIATILMSKVTKCLDSSELSAFKRSTVTMKACGDKRDIIGFQKQAESVIKILLEKEPLDECSGNGADDPPMYQLFLQLQPKSHYNELSILSMKGAYETSSFAAKCQTELEPTKRNRIRVLSTNVLHFVWFPQSPDQKPDTKYLKMVQRVFDTVREVTHKANELFEAFMKLLPPKYRSHTRALWQEILASHRALAQKKAIQKRKAQDRVDSRLFISSSSTLLRKSQVGADPPADRSAAATNSSQLPKPDTNLKRRAIMANPYAKKRALAETKANAQPAKPAAKPTKPSLSSYIERLEANPYIPVSTSEKVKRIPPNAPKDLSCPICNADMREPLLAPCGHMACPGCWKDWLQRSQTCPTCRQATRTDDLARAVFAGTSQKLSQHMADESDDEELDFTPQTS